MKAWLRLITGAAALGLAAQAATPDWSSALAAKYKSDLRAKAPPAPLQPITGPIDTQAQHALIIAAETGAVLLDKGGEERIPPASMSKVMTAYMVFDYLKQGRAALTDELPVSERAWRTGGSKMWVPIGKRVKIEDLLRGMIVQSGNDACVVLAEGLAGSEQAFVEQMNEKAQQIGLTGSHFANVDGLPNPDHWMTARDLATLALRTIKDFPEYYHYYSEKEYNFNTVGLNNAAVNINQGNRNPLLYKDIGADGLKTGHTEEAGYSLLASVKRDKRRIVMVLNGLPSMKTRAMESERLVEWAFREFNDYRLFAAGDKVDDAEVWLGSEPKVPLTVTKDLVVTLPRKSRKEMKVSVQFDKPVPAPVAQGQVLGRVVVTAPDVPPVEAPLVAAAAVERMGPLGRMAMVAAHLIWGNRH
jgi:D-alanyl-D-alanine carboxypeptidase (penicillin-binding protein 5/6)